VSGGGRAASSRVEIRGDRFRASRRRPGGPAVVTLCERVAPRGIEADDSRGVEEAIGELFDRVRGRPNTDSTSASPARFLRTIFDTTTGHQGDVELLVAFLTEHGHGAVPRADALVELMGPEGAQSVSATSISARECAASERTLEDRYLIPEGRAHRGARDAP
jgi:hypothetical protein